jgi:dolichyl-phosphate-mannose--protein O-mannosyl transferase
VLDDVEKFNYLFFYFWVGLLFCRLLWSGFDDLVSVMEGDPACSMDNFYEQCESRFLGTIGAKLSKEQRDVTNAKLYEAG